MSITSSLLFPTNMENENKDALPLLEKIPSARRTPEQVARWTRYERGEKKKTLPTYKLLRHPVNLQEIYSDGRLKVIWRTNNKTRTYVEPHGTSGYPDEDRQKRNLDLQFEDEGPQFRIFGETDNAVARTVAFFMGLDAPTETISQISIKLYGGYPSSNFGAAGSHCFAHILEVNPTCRTVELSCIKLSVDQAIVLATRPFPIQLSLSDCAFTDGGTAFVDALGSRQTPFGSLDLDRYIYSDVPLLLESHNLMHLLQFDTIDHLSLPPSEEDSNDLDLLTIAANVKSLDYDVPFPSDTFGADLQQVEIVAKKLCLHVGHEDFTLPAGHMLSFWQSMATFRHFEELEVEFESDDNLDVSDDVAQAIVRAAVANPNLTMLHLQRCEYGPHMREILDGLKDHPGLCTLKVTVQKQDEAFGPNFSYLRQLLSHNRKITVLSSGGQVFTDGSSIDKLYALNRNYFYWGSKNLVGKLQANPATYPLQATLSERSFWVASALVEGASNHFQRSTDLMAEHNDALFELFQLAQIDGF